MHAWWRLSAAQGHEKAKEFLVLIGSIMTGQQLQAAKDLSKTLIAAR